MGNIDPIPNVPIPTPVSRQAGIGEASKNVLVRFVVDVFNRLKDSLAELIRNALERFLESLEKPLVVTAGPLLDDVLDYPGLPPSVRSAIERTRSGTDQVAVGGLLIAIATVIMMLVPAGLSGVQAKVRQISFALTRPFLLDFGSWYAAVRRDPTLDSTMVNDLRGQGWREDQITAARLAAEQRLGVNEILRANHRGKISDVDALQRIAQLGIPPSDAAIAFDLGKQIPGPADLVRFAQREAWRDDVAAKYGYDADWSPQFGEWMEKQGFDVSWARAYHRARWTLPGIQSGLNLLYRRKITEDEFKDLLMVQDIPQWWRQKIFESAYNPYTRVDIRRMFQAGKVTPQEVYDNYRDLGSDDNKAQKLTDWTIAEYGDDEKTLTRASIEKAYKRRMIGPTEAITMLGDIGIRGEAAELYLDIIDFDLAMDRQDDQAKAVRTRFLAGQITEAEARSRLVGIGVLSERIDDLLEDWRASLAAKVKMPTRANLESFVKDGVIDPGQYTEQMRLLNYSELHIGWYTESIARERQEQAAKEEVAARKEQERIDAARIKTEYQREKARLDVDIAELQAAIAEDQLSIVVEQNERDQALAQSMSLGAIAEIEREYLPLQREAEAEISSSRLEIVNVQAAIKVLQEQAEQGRVSLVENVDVALGVMLRAERLELQTENARLTELIRQRETVLARLEQVLVETPEAITEEEAAITEAQANVEMAEFQELQATNTVRIEEIDQALQETLSETRRQELEVQRATIQAEIAGLNTEITDLRVIIRQAEQALAEYKQEIQDQIDMLPGAAEQIEIKLYYDQITDEIQANIKQYQQNIAELRLAKSRLTAEWRQ